jgi:putative ABC transport system permease protein
MLAKLAWRNVFRQRRRTVLTLLTMTGSFVLSSISIGWMEGSYGSIIMFFTNSRTGQIQIHGEGYMEDPSIYETVDDYLDIGAVLDSIPGVRTWAPRIYTGALLAVRPEGSGAGGVFSNSAAASVTGIEPDMEERATGFSSQLVQGDMLSASAADTSYFAVGQIVLGRELAVVLDASVGDSLVMLSQAADGGSADRKYVIIGIQSTGNADVDRNTCYITLKDAQLLFSLEGRVHEMAIMTGSLARVDGLTERIRTRLSGRELEVDSWKSFAREFYNGMKADESSLRITIFVIVLVAAMGVLNTILMMVLERSREFWVMKALGTRPDFIVRMIVLEANIMGLMSIIAGVVISTVVLFYLSHHGLVLNPPIDYGGTVFREMIATVNPACYWVPALCVILTASTVSIPPALKAAHTKAAKTLRTV